jgi:hypothetical protein
LSSPQIKYIVFHNNRGICVGNIPIESISETYALLAKHFGAFGPIEQINVKAKFG